MIDKLLERVNYMKKTISSDDDKEKINVITELLNDSKLLRNLDVETIFGILDFLGFSELEAVNIYKELMAFKTDLDNEEYLSFEITDDELNLKL